MGEWASGRVGEWASGRVGEWASGRVGEWASGRVSFSIRQNNGLSHAARRLLNMIVSDICNKAIGLRVVAIGLRVATMFTSSNCIIVHFQRLQ